MLVPERTTLDIQSTEVDSWKTVNLHKTDFHQLHMPAPIQEPSTKLRQWRHQACFWSKYWQCSWNWNWNHSIIKQLRSRWLTNYRTDPASRNAKPHCMKKMTIDMTIRKNWSLSCLMTETSVSDLLNRNCNLSSILRFVKISSMVDVIRDVVRCYHYQQQH